MDGFSDSLSQHFATPQDMIAANAQADADEMKSLQEQVDKYEGVIDRINQAADSLDKKINEIQPKEAPAPVIDTQEYTSKLNGMEGKIQEHIHKENVRVYRNVQASVADELNKQTEDLSEILGRLEVKTAQLESRLSILDNAVSEMGEKIASGIESASADTADKISMSRKGRAILPLQIVGLVVVIADLAVNVIHLLGII